MKIIKGAFIIMLFCTLGEISSALINGFIPGNVIGMMLLFLALYCNIVKFEDVKLVSHFLTKNMTIFFVPASIGIMDQWGMIKNNLTAFIMICILTTAIVIVVVGYVMQQMIRKEPNNE